MTRIAFIGLGIMGSPMAVHLARAGHQVTGYNRTPEKTAAVVAAGGRAAASVAEAVRDAEVVALMVSDTPDVEEVLAGEGGVFEHARPGALVVDFSTIRPDAAADHAARSRARGLRHLDAPVSGGEPGAVAASLSIMVGGSAPDFAAARPLLDVLGRTVVHVGPSGAGQTVKAANQLIGAAHLEALAEALVFLEAYGVDTEAAFEVLGGGMAGSRVLEQKGADLRARSYRPGFRVDLHHKDLGILTAAAGEAGLVLPLGTLVAELMAAVRAAGDGDLDHSALLRGVERLNGRLTG